MSDVAAKKTSQPKKPATHPKYSEMVAQALTSLKERGGSSRQAILKYSVANFKVEEDSAKIHLKTALKNGVKNESLKQSKGTGASGSFKLGEVKKPAGAKPKKTVKPKTDKKSPKKATKKTAEKKKKTGEKAKKTTGEKKTKKTAEKTKKTTDKTKKTKTPEKKKTATKPKTTKPKDTTKTKKAAPAKKAPKPEQPAKPKKTTKK